MPSREFNVLSVAYEADPPVLKPGEPGSISVKIAGEAALEHADLSNVAVALQGIGASTPLVPSVSRAEPIGEAVRRELTFPFTAPVKPGPYSISIAIPNIASFEEVIFVIRALSD
jgi:hypothetical protein